MHAVSNNIKNERKIANHDSFTRRYRDLRLILRDETRKLFFFVCCYLFIFELKQTSEFFEVASDENVNERCKQHGCKSQLN